LLPSRPLQGMMEECDVISVVAEFMVAAE
jgi:hypothetical protein